MSIQRILLASTFAGITAIGGAMLSAKPAVAETARRGVVPNCSNTDCQYVSSCAYASNIGCAIAPGGGSCTNTKC
jgi:hypothetical protein